MKILVLALLILAVTGVAYSAEASSPPAVRIIYSRLNTNSSGAVSYDLYSLDIPGSLEPVRLTEITLIGDDRLGSLNYFPVISPDKQKVLFHSSAPDPDSKKMPYGRSDFGISWTKNMYLYVLDIISGKYSRLTEANKGYAGAAWSKDCQYVAAAAEVQSPFHGIFVYSVPTRMQTLLTSIDTLKVGAIGAFVWKNDHNLIFVTTRYKYEIMSSYADPGVLFSAFITQPPVRVRELTSYPHAPSRISLSSDGVRMVYHDYEKLCVSNVDGTGSKGLLQAEYPSRFLLSCVPAWAPDDSRIAFAGRLPGKGCGVWFYNMKTGKWRFPWATETVINALKWSRDGKWILASTIFGPIWINEKETYREGLVAISTADGSRRTLKKLDETTMGLDFYELDVK